MKLPRVRFTIQRIMVMVGVVGLLMGGAMEIRRLMGLSRAYQIQLRKHEQEKSFALLTRNMNSTLLAETSQERVEWLEYMRKWRYGPGPRVELVIGPDKVADWDHFEQNLKNLDENLRITSSEIELQSRRVEYHEAMIRKYRYLARSPWISVELDPPEPK